MMAALQFTSFGLVRLFDNRIEKSFLKKMIDADNEDQNKNDRKRTALRNCIVDAVDALKPLRDRQHHISFLRIDGVELLIMIQLWSTYEY